MDRRQFLSSCGLLAAAGSYPASALAATAARMPRWAGRETNADIVVVGAGLGGVAAALAALRMGRRVILTEETDWIGGQLTSQAVPPDEHRFIETHGCTRSYRRLRDGIRAYYRDYYPLIDEARATPHLNPGNGRVSRLCHEPRVAVAVLEAMLAPFISAGQLVVLLNTRAIAAETDGDRITSVTLGTGAGSIVARAPWFIDGTETGELLPLAGVEYVTGAEGRQRTGEDHAPATDQPANHQSFTWIMAMDYRPGEDHRIDKPAQYDFWRSYVPNLTPPWPGRLLELNYSSPRSLEPRELAFIPTAPGVEETPTEPLNLWLYRRILDGDNFLPGAIPTDVSIMNWPQNDYWLGNVYDLSDEAREKHLEGSRQLTLSLFYWLQTEAPRPDGGQGWQGLRPRGDILGTADGLAKYPYIRESRRIEAEFTILEQHVSYEARTRDTGLPRSEVKAVQFGDSVGIGSYNIDLHPSSGGDNYIDIASLPFQIPLGALIPRRVENLLAANKNLGTTHITNGCYRLHPVEWNIGEAAGAAAAFAFAKSTTPRAVRADTTLLADFQAELLRQGFELAWKA